MNELHLGSVKDNSLLGVIKNSKDDILKMCMHLSGPKRILELVKECDPEYELPAHYVHIIVKHVFICLFIRF